MKHGQRMAGSSSYSLGEIPGSSCSFFLFLLGPQPSYKIIAHTECVMDLALEHIYIYRRSSSQLYAVSNRLLDVSYHIKRFTQHCYQ